MDYKFIIDRYLYNRRIVDGYKYQFKPYGGGCLDEGYFKPVILKTGDVFLDVGASAGGWSIPASMYYREVHAFEANVQVVRTLKKNLVTNKVRNVIIHQYGVGDKNEIRDFHIYPERGLDSFVPSHNMWESTGETIRVRMITLDSCKLAPTVLKVDTEGYEVPVLKGGLGTIDHCHPALCIETHEEGDVERVKELLEPYRYSWNVFPRVQGDGTKQQIMIGN